MGSKKAAKKKQLQGKELSSQEKAKVAAPRNPFVMAAAEGKISGAGAHADKRRDSKNGKIKHKKSNFGY